MTYKRYLELGFERIDCTDNVEFNLRGYNPFHLEKKLSEHVFLSVYSFDLKNPKIYIRKRGQETYHILPISCEVIKDLLNPDKPIDYSNLA
jgi:hypothetical protein